MSNIPDIPPYELLDSWLKEAAQHEQIKEPTAMCLATADAQGQPAARIVLMKGLDERGLVFYSNEQSDKGRQLAENPKAALLFYWMPLQRQVRFEGAVSKVTEAEADAYFATRHPRSRHGAWASQQSRPLEDYTTLEQAVEEVAGRYPGEDIPRPPHWVGWRLAPERIEFWQEGESRLHHRRLYTRAADNRWSSTLLYP